MSYPPPPGIGNLPAKPPSAARGGFKAAFGPSRPSPSASASPAPGAAPSYHSAPSYGPSAPAQHGGSYNSYPSAAPGSVSSFPFAPRQAQPQAPQQGYGQQSYGAQSYGAPTYAAPAIQNPFPLPGTGGAGAGSDFDPEMAAQIAQWQSAYVTKEPTTTKDGKPAEAEQQQVHAQAAANPNEKKKTVAREGGGKKWTDETLLEWDPSHLRLFVGNLAGETTDDSLLKAFVRWKSVQKARVVRDKRTTKSKGYGFVSFSDADDFFQAAKEMNGKYIQSHPVVVRKANTEIKVTNVKERDRGHNKNKNKNKNKNNGAGGGGGGGGYEPNLGPVGGAGVTKPGQKTKNGLRLLG